MIKMKFIIGDLHMKKFNRFIALLFISSMTPLVGAISNEAFIADQGGSQVTVIDVQTNAIIATIDVGANPIGIAVTPDRSEVFVTNASSGNVSVIEVV